MHVYSNFTYSILLSVWVQLSNFTYDLISFIIFYTNKGFNFLSYIFKSYIVHDTINKIK